MASWAADTHWELPAVVPGTSDLDFLSCLTAGALPSSPPEPPRSSSAPAAAPAALAVAPPAQTRRLVWRCLDTAHAPECQRCTPPPPDAEALLYVLHAESGAPPAPRPSLQRAVASRRGGWAWAQCGAVHLGLALDRLCSC